MQVSGNGTHQSEAPSPKGREKKRRSSEWFETKQTTSVYVTGLPDDVTVGEMIAVFKKCGLIREDEAGQPKIKIYRQVCISGCCNGGIVLSTFSLLAALSE